jgi:hypothetical protein
MLSKAISRVRKGGAHVFDVLFFTFSESALGSSVLFLALEETSVILERKEPKKSQA